MASCLCRRLRSPPPLIIQTPKQLRLLLQAEQFQMPTPHSRDPLHFKHWEDEDLQTKLTLKEFFNSLVFFCFHFLISLHLKINSKEKRYFLVFCPSGPGTSSGPRSMTLYLRGRRFLAPPFRFPASVNHTMGPTCARPRTTTDVPPTITPC